MFGDAGLTQAELSAIEARKAEQQRIADEQERMYDGRTEEQIILEFGAPSRIERLPAMSIFYYRTDNGSTSSGGGAVFGRVALTRGRSNYHFEETTFIFKEGKVIKWDYTQQ